MLGALLCYLQHSLLGTQTLASPSEWKFCLWLELLKKACCGLD
jgi:hypothetical protein